MLLSPCSLWLVLLVVLLVHSQSGSQHVRIPSYSQRRLPPSCVVVCVLLWCAGYGYESYPDCPLEFSGIGNIHVSLPDVLPDTCSRHVYWAEEIPLYLTAEKRVESYSGGWVVGFIYHCASSGENSFKGWHPVFVLLRIERPYHSSACLHSR